MQHDYVLKKLNFDLLTPTQGSWGICGQTICYHAGEVSFPLIWCATWSYSENSLILASVQPPKSTQGVGSFDLKSRLIYFIFILPLSASEISLKILTTVWVIAKFKYLTFDFTLGVRGWGKVLFTVMLIYRHCVIMAYGEKLSGKMWSLFTKSKYNFSISLNLSQKGQ